MKSSFLLFGALIIAASLALTGCSQSHASDHAHDEPATAALYKAGYGVKLSAAARTFAQLETQDVATRSIADRVTLAVPIDAVVRTVRGDFVYVVNGEWFLRTPVKTDARDLTHIEITTGLYEGDTVVARGVQALVLSEIQALNGGVGCADGH